MSRSSVTRRRSSGRASTVSWADNMQEKWQMKHAHFVNALMNAGLSAQDANTAIMVFKQEKEQWKKNWQNKKAADKQKKKQMKMSWMNDYPNNM